MLNFFKKFITKHSRGVLPRNIIQNSCIYDTAKPAWTPRNYRQAAEQAYLKNVISYRSIALIAQSAANIPIKLYKDIEGIRVHITDHPVAKLLSQPNPMQGFIELLESIYSYKQIYGNAYLLAVTDNKCRPAEIYSLRPDRVQVIPGEHFLPKAYRYSGQCGHTDYPVNQLDGNCKILHIKNFHPLSDWYGMAPAEAASYSIDQHNQASEWNQALLQNGAKPSGIITVRNAQGDFCTLSPEQFSRIKEMVDERFSGPENAGRPLILEGGLEWQPTCLSHEKMEFSKCKEGAARDIGIGFGVPSQMLNLGIKGDNTYSNLKAAELAFWDRTVLPLANSTLKLINRWLQDMFDENFELVHDIENITALAARRDANWESVEKASFMTINEKREAVGLSPTPDAEQDDSTTT